MGECSATNKIKLVFDDSNVFKLKAQFDLKLIEACILLNHEKFGDSLTGDNYAEELGALLTNQFMGHERKKNIDHTQLNHHEEPEMFKIEKKFMIIASYLDNQFTNLPPLCKELKNESEASH